LKAEVRNPRRETKAIRWIIFFVIVSRIALIFRPEEQIYTRPYVEDSFYLFNCAEHVAHGDGFTCDGKQPTNGVQPLIVLFYVPLFLIAGVNKLLALKLGFILVAAFDSLSVIFIARLLRLLQKKPEEEIPVWRSPSVIGALLWAGLYSVYEHTGIGLETGLYSALLLASVTYYAQLSITRSKGDPVRLWQWAAFGSLLGFTVLARIDAVLLVAAIALYELYKFKGRGGISGVVLSLVAFIISSPWWYYSYHTFGSIMPQSGIAESMHNGALAENIMHGVITAGNILSIFFFLPNYDFPGWFYYAWFFAAGIGILWLTKRYSLKHYLRQYYNTSSLTPLYLFCGALLIYYVFFFAAPHFLSRYFQPLRITGLVLAACVLPKIILHVADVYRRKKNIALPLIVTSALIIAGLNVSGYAYNFLISRTTDFYYIGKFALAHPDQKIGMDQSGTAGFIAPNVINLDGKVNYEALMANKVDDIGSYVLKEKIDYIADWKPFSEAIVASASRYGAKFEAVDSIGLVIIYKRIK
jgi:hypothetical protein